MISRKKRSLLCCAFLAVAGFSAFSASASTMSGAHIVGVAVQGNIVLLDTTGARSNTPSCSGSWWASDVSTAGGQAMLAIVLTAYAQKVAVNITGTGTCNVSGDREGVTQIYATSS